MPLRDRVGEAVTANWHVKLAALGLAAVLWALVAAGEPTTQRMTLPVSVQLPQGRSLTQPLPTVTAVLAGSARELLKLYATPPVIRKTVPDTAADSTYTLALSLTDIDIPKHVDARAQDLEPRSVLVRLENVARVTLPVVPRVTVRPDSGFALSGGIAVEPGSVLVVGPAPRLAHLDHLSTVAVELSQVTGPVHRAVDIDTAGLGPVRPTQREVQVSADVEPISERVLMGVPVVVRGDRGSGAVIGAAWASDPPAVMVTVRGPTARLVRLTRDSVEVAALPSGPGRPETVRLEVVAPAGVDAAAMPDTVVVQRRVRG